jgi:Cu/Ag efflux pump CusA
VFHIFFIFDHLINVMQETTISIIVAAVALIVAVLAFFAVKNPKRPAAEQKDKYSSLPLQLQAYERLVLLCERISIPNLISRTNIAQLSAREMQVILLENIKQEFEYNASQQIYVTPIAWESVRNLKDHSMLIINQVAGLLPPEARASDLNRQLLDVVMNQQDQPLHLAVLDTLSFEAKKLMK